MCDFLFVLVKLEALKEEKDHLENNLGQADVEKKVRIHKFAEFFEATSLIF